jgi:hypothetical protein
MIMPKPHPAIVIVNNSVMKYPATRLFGHPAALIKPKSRVLWAIMKKAIKEVSTAPTAKISMPMKGINCENKELIPIVNMLVADVKPLRRVLNSNRNVVEATLSAKAVMDKLV